MAQRHIINPTRVVRMHSHFPTSGRGTPMPKRDTNPLHSLAPPPPSTSSQVHTKPVRPDVTPHRQHLPVHKVLEPRQNRSTVLQRQSVQRSAVAIYKATRRRKVNTILVLAIASGVFLIGISIGAYGFWMMRNSKGQVAGAQDEKASKAKELSFEDIPTIDDYKNHYVKSAEPRYVRIPALAVKARIQQVNLDPTIGLQLPPNIFDVGWYGQSAKPADTGTMVMSVQTRGITVDSYFEEISAMQVGSFIEIEQGNGRRTLFKMTGTSAIAQGKFNIADVTKSVDSQKQGLNIVVYSPVGERGNRYEPLLIVHAVRM
jgi:hypothetical protein